MISVKVCSSYSSIFFASTLILLQGCSDRNNDDREGLSSSTPTRAANSHNSSFHNQSSGSAENNGSGQQSSGGHSSENSGSESSDVGNLERLSAGDATVFSTGASAFELSSANLRGARAIRSFNLGNDFFKNPWVPNRSTTSLRDGLGPHFNNNACQDCHVRDGRGHAPALSETESGTDFSTILIRTSKSDLTEQQKKQIGSSLLPSIGDSVVGNQIQHLSNPNIKAEALLSVRYEELEVSFDDGFTVSLRKPFWSIQSGYLDEGLDFDSDTVFSARIAPPMIGLGLLSLISEDDILKQQDVDDANGDGISGKVNYVWSIEKDSIELGRFGWKAGQPSIKEQTAGAFLGDMGLTSMLLPNENCMPHQADCINADNGNGDQNEQYDYEVSDRVLDIVTFYASHLAVPARRAVNDDIVQEGKRLFSEAGCEACHTASYITGSSESLPELSEQLIFPYTDMLLHDMGHDLADFSRDNTAVSSDVFVEYLASATEWRTPPLWGLGLTKEVDPKATFLHDGRARTIMEAVLWHGGEAAVSRGKVLSFSKAKRQAFLAFLNDL